MAAGLESGALTVHTLTLWSYWLSAVPQQLPLPPLACRRLTLALTLGPFRLRSHVEKRRSRLGEEPAGGEQPRLWGWGEAHRAGRPPGAQPQHARASSATSRVATRRSVLGLSVAADPRAQ